MAIIEMHVFGSRNGDDAKQSRMTMDLGLFHNGYSLTKSLGRFGGKLIRSTCLFWQLQTRRRTDVPISKVGTSVTNQTSYYVIR